jgi:2-polyprenyl-3-methyl-5-hydroxy-6-metoxy-1,4-benzoquinol methylase
MANEIKYDQDYWDYQSKIGKIGGFLNLFKFEKHIKEQDTVLDFGCGGGFLLEQINCKNKIGFDVNDKALERARDHGLNVTNDFSSIEDESVDIVISNHALEHVPDPLPTLQDIYKKVKKGGMLVIVVPCEQYNRDGFFYDPNDKNQHLYSWCPQSLGNLVRLANFKVLSSDVLLHTWTPDWEQSYKDYSYHDRCVQYSKETGIFQIKVISEK